MISAGTVVPLVPVRVIGPSWHSDTRPARVAHLGRIGSLACRRSESAPSRNLEGFPWFLPAAKFFWDI